MRDLGRGTTPTMRVSWQLSLGAFLAGRRERNGTFVTSVQAHLQPERHKTERRRGTM